MKNYRLSLCETASIEYTEEEFRKLENIIQLLTMLQVMLLLIQMVKELAEVLEKLILDLHMIKI